MFAVKPLSSLQSDLSRAVFLRPPAIGIRQARVSGRQGRVNGGAVKAAISSGDKTMEAEKGKVPYSDTDSSSSSSSASPAAASSGMIELRAVLTVRKKMRQRLVDKMEDQLESFINGIGQGISLRLVSEEVDPVTKSGKSVESTVRGWLPQQSEHPYIAEYAADFSVPGDFGCPGAVLVTNLHGKEFHLSEIVIHGFSEGPVYFSTNTWIHARKDNPESRIIFRNQAYLPSETPPGLKDLRHEDLLGIRGNGKGERKAHERIYDYAPYNDLGNPDKDDELARPVLGCDDRPYPRRCRTGRPPMRTDPLSESRIEKPNPVYVPRDETFEEIKQNTFAAGRMKALLHNLVPSIAASLSSSDIPFKCFSEIDRLYINGLILKEGDQMEAAANLLIPNVMKEVLTVGQKLLKYEVPAIISRDRFAWLRDNEFARQALAGVNPVSIELLKEFPIVSKLDPAIYGRPESALTRELIEKEIDGMSVEKAIEEKRLFIIDYHDMLLPFIDKINSLPNRKAYASRTLFFYNQSAFLRPIAIELTLPATPTSPQNKRVYTHGHDSTSHWIWKQAKAHVCSVDAGVHQL
ncbi:hypothetical protein CRG98_002527, partial [Punica granatum]